TQQDRGGHAQAQRDQHGAGDHEDHERGAEPRPRRNVAERSPAPRLRRAVGAGCLAAHARRSAYSGCRFIQASAYEQSGTTFQPFARAKSSAVRTSSPATPRPPAGGGTSVWVIAMPPSASVLSSTQCAPSTSTSKR